MADLRALNERRQDISDRAAGLIAARNRLAEEAERAGRVVAVKEWASRSATTVDGTVDGDGRRLISVYNKGDGFCNQNGQQIKSNGGRSSR